MCKVAGKKFALITRLSKYFLLPLFVFFPAVHLFGQKTPPPKDSLRVYENIESYSKRNGVANFVYKLVFRPLPSGSKKKVVTKKIKRKVQRPNSEFEGKIIRNISIETLDPFGYTFGDTVQKNQNTFTRFGNKLHIKSQRVTIRNLLLVRQNDVFDSMLVQESERLVRSQKYVTDVLFYIVAAGPDSVDIFIRELDKWTLLPKMSFNNSRVTVKLNDRNFMGWGHDFRNSYTWFHDTGDDAFYTDYFIPNIRNTYINTGLHYGTDEYGFFTKSLSLDRPFYSPFAKWAAGINFTQQFRKDSILSGDSVAFLQKIKFNAQDYWAGYAFQIFKGNTENERTTNLISSLRFLRIRFLQRPGETFDTARVFADENFYMGSIGISTRKYVRDKFVFRYGVTEDIPVGRLYSITGGYQVKNGVERSYFGARIANGKYFSWGYLSNSVEYGTFFKGSAPEQGVLKVGITYFTGLVEVGNWKFRQFVKPEVTIGINRFNNDSLTINDGYGLDGFNCTGLSGTNRILFTLQTQSYAPWNFVGFRFGPYLVYTLGMLGDEASGFKNSRVYSQFGIGLLIKNEFLVLNTFEISIAFYPLIPGNGNNVLKFNSFKTNDFGTMDFDMGKPAVATFQ